jgi:hypothetical protein
MFANMPLNLWHLLTSPHGLVGGNPAARPGGLTMGSAASPDEPRLSFPAQVFTHMAATPLGIPGDIEAFSRLAMSPFGASRENTTPSGSDVTQMIARALMGLMERQQRAQLRQPMPMTQSTPKRASGW